MYDKENPFTRMTYSGTSWLDGDTDGDGIYDGMDDNDHDDFWNAEEIESAAPGASTTQGPIVRPSPWHTGLWVNPFNPCLPNRNSRTCPVYVRSAPTRGRRSTTLSRAWPEWTRAADHRRTDAPIAIPQ